MLIIAATNGVDLDAVNELIRQYDMARMDSDRERLLEQVDQLIGHKVRGTLRQKLRLFSLTPDEIDALAHEAIDQALKGVGRVRYRRGDIQPEELVRQMTSGTNPRGMKLLELLSDDLRQALQAPFLKQDVVSRLNRELSGLLGRSELAKELGISGHAASESAIERTNDNARMLASAFPGAIMPVQEPPSHLLGFLDKEVLRNIVARETRERGQISPETMRVWKSIQPIVEALKSQSGGVMPPVDQVVEAYRQSLDRYRPAIDWWEEQLRFVGRPFRIKDPRAYADAREILEEKGYDPSLWTNEESPYYISKEALKPHGKKAIEQVLSTPGLAAPRLTSPRPPLEQTPAPSAPPAEPPAPSWAMEMGEQGRGGELYRAMVEMIFPDTKGVERQIGEFLADNPSPSNDNVEEFLDEMSRRDPNAAALARASWPEIVRRVDRAIIEGLGDQRLMSTMSEEFGFSAMASLRYDVRRSAFLRGTQLLRFAS